MLSFVMIMLAVMLANLVSGTVLMVIAFLIMLNPRLYRWMVNRCIFSLGDDELLK